jgi:hypothetical protein
MYIYSKPVPGLSAIQSAKFVELVHDYEKALVEDGYKPHVVRFHLHSVAHFVVWFELEDVELETMDERTVAAFERHRTRCRCPGPSRNHRRSVVSCVRVFLRHLRKQGRVRAAETPAETRVMVGEFLQWMTAHRGAVPATLFS